MVKGLELKIGGYGPYEVYVSYLNENRRGPWNEILVVRGPGIDKYICRDRVEAFDMAMQLEKAYEAGKSST